MPFDEARAKAKELVAEEFKAARADIARETKEMQESLRENLDTQLKELEPRIKAGEAAGEGVAELKEQSAERAKDNAKNIDAIKETVQKHMDGVNERIEKLETGIGSAFINKDGQLNLGKGLAEQVLESGMNSRTPQKQASFSFDGKPSPIWRKDITASSTDAFVPQYHPAIIGPGERQIRVIDLIPRVATQSAVVFYVRETSLTDNAGPQGGVGATKGETTWTLTPASVPIETIAHFVQVPKQYLDDMRMLEGYINSRMTYMLEAEVENQVLNGDGSSNALTGLIDNATAFDVTLVSGSNDYGVEALQDLDRIRAAIAQVAESEFQATGVVLNVHNWAAMELLKDSQERYIFARPQDSAVPRLWGVPVVSTTVMASPNFLVGAFALGAMIWDREQAQVAVSTEDSDNFQKNLATVRAEERLAQTIFRSLAFVEGDFANTIT